MCNNIVEIWFGIANGHILSILTELSARDMIVVDIIVSRVYFIVSGEISVYLMKI